MQITSKYPGKCTSCGGRFSAGTRIEWARGRGASHVRCDPDMLVGTTGKTRADLAKEWDEEHRGDPTLLDRFEAMRVSRDYTDVPEDAIYQYACEDTQRNPYR